LALAVAEIAMSSGLGVTVNYSDWRHLFCEDPHRFVAAVAPESSARLAELAEEIGIPAAVIGYFGGTEIVFDRHGVKAAVDLDLATSTWRDALPRRLT
jgi:phosphoribosylformylglycinamidine synthase